MDRKEHWNKVYTRKEPTALGWYETAPEPSLRLLARCHLAPEDPIVDAGSGASLFVDCLLARGFQRVTVFDISDVAMDASRRRLGPERAAQITWRVADASVAADLADLHGIALWHDRALLHFLVDESDRAVYAGTLGRAVRPGGYVILAAFACHGATHCSGLPVERYTAEKMGHFLGPEFHLLTSFDYLYTMPSGDTRPYVYACFQHAGGG